MKKNHLLKPFLIIGFMLLLFNAKAQYYGYDYNQPCLPMDTFIDPFSSKEVLVRVEMGMKDSYTDYPNFMTHGRAYFLVTVRYADGSGVYPHYVQINFDTDFTMTPPSAPSYTVYVNDTVVWNGLSAAPFLESGGYFYHYHVNDPIYTALSWDGACTYTHSTPIYIP